MGEKIDDVIGHVLLQPYFYFTSNLQKSQTVEQIEAKLHRCDGQSMRNKKFSIYVLNFNLIGRVVWQSELINIVAATGTETPACLSRGLILGCPRSSRTWGHRSQLTLWYGGLF